MKIAIIGNSGHGAAAVSERNLQTDGEVIGYCPGFPEESLDGLEKVFEQKGIRSCRFSSPQEMLSHIKPDVLVVDSMFSQHSQWAEWGLKNGIHVFCEKPLATELDQLESLAKTAEKSHALLWGILPTRYMPWFYTAKQLIEQGAVGKIRLFQGQKSYKLGTRPDFFQHRECFGGITPWVSVHLIDLMLWFSGSLCEKVSSFQSSQDNFGHGDLEMVSTTIMKLEHDILAQINADYYRPSAAPSHGDDRLRIVGTEGVLEIQMQQVTLIDSKGFQKIPLINPERELFEDFLYHIQHPEQTSPRFSNGLLSSYVCLKAREAADQEKTISLLCNNSPSIIL